MTTLMNKVFAFFRRYRNLVKIIDSKISYKGIFKSVFGAIMMSTLILLIPTLIVINMFIYAKLTFILSIMLLVFILLWTFLYYFFYYKLLKNYFPTIQDIDTRIPQYVESTIVSMLFLILGIIILSTLF
ncbi:MAG: hypothetical protein CVV61_04380 [Tenericutes bacterium HGW-Tenericutes-6]|nr:MAG: hypothetical protein CVV61_04380 [Tenericutes bacterium HGW-Tenericutes-6]